MSNGKNSKIISYVPQTGAYDNDSPPQDAGSLRRGLWYYKNKLGLDFTLALGLSLAYQVLMAAFVGLHGITVLPALNQFAKSQFAISLVVTIVLWGLLQLILLSELAQVVWLEQFDKLKIRLMLDSFWWWIILFALIVSLFLDFALLFLALTATDNFWYAWQIFTISPLSTAVISLFMLINVLTLLRCASAMRTSTKDEIRKQVEERLQARAEEMLLNAGDETFAKAKQVWRSLAVEPASLVPLQNSVLALISQSHPELAALGGQTWAYDFNSNQLAALPSDVYGALSQHRNRVFRNGSSNENDLYWKLPPSDTVELLESQFETQGSPTIVDVTSGTPRYATNTINLPTQANQLATESGTAGVLADLTRTELSQFKAYLKQAYQQQNGCKFEADTPGTTILDEFSERDLSKYLRRWEASLSH